MVRRIKIKTASIDGVYAELSEENPRTAEAIWNALPLSGIANTWGDEIYFSIPVDFQEENSREVVEMGDLAYWPPGKAFCIFFGKTPVSKAGEIRPASPVNVFGSVDGDPTVFKRVGSGEEIEIEKA
ncbi:MAG: cyclophilin-like fold protein [Candidatus Bathyarchaeia archaeon]